MSEQLELRKTIIRQYFKRFSDFFDREITKDFFEKEKYHIHGLLSAFCYLFDQIEDLHLSSFLGKLSFMDDSFFDDIDVFEEMHHRDDVSEPTHPLFLVAMSPQFYFELGSAYYFTKKKRKIPLVLPINIYPGILKLYDERPLHPIIEKQKDKVFDELLFWERYYKCCTKHLKEFFSGFKDYDIDKAYGVSRLEYYTIATASFMPVFVFYIACKSLGCEVKLIPPSFLIGDRKTKDIIEKYFSEHSNIMDAYFEENEKDEDDD